jgi:hypothetical protein
MLVLEVEKQNIEMLQELIQLPDYTQVVEPSNLDGETIIQLFIEINKVTAPLIAGIILAYVNSNKIKIKKNGINITMLLTKKNLKKTELIKELLKIGEDTQEEDVKDETHD